MRAFAVFAAILAAASANPQIIYNGLGGLGYSGLGHIGGLGYSGLTYAASPAYGYAAGVPAVVAHSPVVAGVTKTQYHAQDELGQASFGHSEPTQAHAAVRDAAGNVRGTFSYISPEGQTLTTHYVADQGGYRVASNALPVAPAVNVVGPVDTPEVAAAKAQHFAAVAEAQARSGRKKRGIVAPGFGYTSQVVHSNVYGYGAPALTYAASPYAYSSVVAPAVQTYSAVAPAVHTYSAVAPAVHTYSAVAAQAVRPAVLTKVVNTPGHAVSYRVDK